MKNFYITTLIYLCSLPFLNAQTVTVSDPTAGAAATYTFTYVTSVTIGSGTSTPNILYVTRTGSYPTISPTVADPNLLDPYVVFKVDGVPYLCSDSFGTTGGSWSSGIQLSTSGASPGITISAGSVNGL